MVPAAAGSLWYWMREGADTPWYPTARIIRQSQPGEWDNVIADVAARLRNFAGG
jgi:hypothetical protein